MPFNFGDLPADISSMFMNIGGNLHPGQPSRNRQEEAEDPGVRIGGNINMNFAEQMPEELSGALRSVMEMIRGAPSEGNPQDNANVSGRSTAN